MCGDSRNMALALVLLLFLPSALSVDIPIICYILNVPPEILSVSPCFGDRLVVDVLVRDNNTVGDVAGIDLLGLGCGWNNVSGFYGSSSGSGPSSFEGADGSWRFVFPFSVSRVWLNVSVRDESESDFFSRLFINRDLVLGSQPSTSLDGGVEGFVACNFSEGVRWKYFWTVTNVFMEVVRWHISIPGWSVLSVDNTSALFKSGDLRMLVNWTDVFSYRCRLDVLSGEAILAVYLPARSSVLVLDPEIVIYVEGGSPVPAPSERREATTTTKRRPSGGGVSIPFSAGSFPYPGAPSSSSGMVFIVVLVALIGMVVIVLVWLISWHEFQPEPESVGHATAEMLVRALREFEGKS